MVEVERSGAGQIVYKQALGARWYNESINSDFSIFGLSCGPVCTLVTFDCTLEAGSFRFIEYLGLVNFMLTISFGVT